MIVEHYENTSNNDIDYDEDHGKFKVKNKLLGFFNLGTSEINEKDLSISKINELKSKADKTTLTDYDINVLYQFAKLEFNYTKSKEEFINIPINQIFIGLKDSQLKTNELMPLAYKYVQSDPDKRKHMIEKFSQEGRLAGNTTLWFYYILFACLIFLFICVYIGLRNKL